MILAGTAGAAQSNPKVPLEVIDQAAAYGTTLRVGFDALQVLQNSPAVTNVVADRAPRASR